MHKITIHRQKILGSALVTIFLIVVTYGAGTAQWWITTVGTFGLGYLVAAIAKPKAKLNTIPA